MTNEEELDRKYGKGLNAEGKPRVQQTLEIQSSTVGLISQIKQKENEDGKDSA
jgi:hypothetical protein